MEAVERRIAVMCEHKVSRWQHTVLQQGDELIRLVAAMRRLPGCLRRQHIQANQGCLPQELGLARTFGILREQHPNMRKLLRCEPNAFVDRNPWLLLGWYFTH